MALRHSGFGVLGLLGCIVLQIYTFRDLGFLSFKVACLWGFRALGCRVLGF